MSPEKNPALDPRLPDVFRNHHSEDIMVRVKINWTRGYVCPDCGSTEAMIGRLSGKPFVWACYKCGGASKIDG